MAFAKLIAGLFDTSTENVIMHINNIVTEVEIDESRTTKDSLVLQNDGSHTVNRKIKYVNLDINGKTVYGVRVEVKIIVCLADDIQLEDTKAMAEYAPGRIIFADSCFSSTEQKSNVRLTLKDKGITIKTL